MLCIFPKKMGHAWCMGIRGYLCHRCLLSGNFFIWGWWIWYYYFDWKDCLTYYCCWGLVFDTTCGNLVRGVWLLWIRLIQKYQTFSYSGIIGSRLAVKAHYFVFSVGKRLTPLVWKKSLTIFYFLCVLMVISMMRISSKRIWKNTLKDVN